MWKIVIQILVYKSFWGFYVKKYLTFDLLRKPLLSSSKNLFNFLDKPIKDYLIGMLLNKFI